MAGFQHAQALHVAATLGLSELLAGGPRDIGELAAATETHAGSLTRLMRALVAIGVYSQDAEGRYANTPLGEALSVGGFVDWVRMIGRPFYWNAWAGLEDSIRTGDNAFSSINGMSVWQWRAQHPDDQAAFDAAMTGITGPVVDAVAQAYDFGRHATVVDVGGGRGALLTAILRRHPSVHGVLFDQRQVVEGAAVPADCERVAGDFFESVPENADAYLLKSVIHDWDDDESTAILRTCRRAASSSTVLLLVEQLLDAAPDPARTAFSDLNMLVMPGGRERTTDEYAALLADAGWSLEQVISTATDHFVLRATASGPTAPASST